MKRKIKPLRSTLVGGLMFLLPVVVIVVLLRQVVVFLRAVASPVVKWIPLESPWAEIAAAAGAIAILLMLCFFAGLMARRAMGRFLSETIESKVHDFYPRYTVIKGIAQAMHGEGDDDEPGVVLVRLDDSTQIGFEMERAADGTVTVFLPGSPDPWSGSVVLMTADRVQPINASFKAAAMTFKSLGKGIAALADGQAETAQRVAAAFQDDIAKADDVRGNEPE